ncbi:butyrophilin subfamily 2 member A1-like [Morphnus guianensis]
MDKQKQLLFYFYPGHLISSPPNSSIIGVIGESVVLPCHVVADNIPEVFSVQWIFHEQSQKITVSRYDGKNKMEKQDERYQGRTEFFHSEFRAGNMSLHLKNVRSSDKGSYACVVSFNDTYHDVLIELQVAEYVFFFLARGGVPSIFLRSHMKQGIGLTCHAVGWFPKPEVIWLDGQGQVRKELSTTKMTMMPAGLYSVVTSMNLKPGSDMEVSCRIVNNLLNTTSESRVLISGLDPKKNFSTTKPVSRSGMGTKGQCKALEEVCEGSPFRDGIKKSQNIECGSTRKEETGKIQRNHKKTVRSVKVKMEMEEVSTPLIYTIPFQQSPNSKNASISGKPGATQANEAGMWLLGRLRKGVAERCRGVGWDVDTILERMDDHMEKRFMVECVDLHPERGHGCDTSEFSFSPPVPVTVDPDCRVLELQVPGTPDVESNASEPAGPNAPSTVPVLLGKEGFAAGKHYWEVEVGQQQDWVLGVLREKGREEEEEGTLPGEDFWALHRSQGEIFSSKGDHRIAKEQMGNSVIGVLLDLEEGQVNFYDAEQMGVMVRMPLRLGKEPAEVFYPFLSKREGTLTPLIRPVLTPVPLKLL